MTTTEQRTRADRHAVPGAGTYPASAPGSGTRADLAGSPARIAAARRSGRRQGLLVATLLILLGAAGAVYLANASTSRIEVMAVAHPVPRGQVVTAADLAVVRVSVEGGHLRVSTPQTAARDFIGKAALIDLPTGMLATPDLVAAATPTAGQVSVGVRLPADAMPAALLRPGELVRVVHTDQASGAATVIAERAQVLSVSAPPANALGDQHTVVYLSVPAPSAQAVAGAAATNDGVRLLGIRP